MATARRFFIPPNGFVGQGQQTSANQLVAGKPSRTAGTRRRRRKSKTTTTRKRTTRRAAPRSRKGAKLVKGSAAAKRRMAQLRKMRRK